GYRAPTLPPELAAIIPRNLHQVRLTMSDTHSYTPRHIDVALGRLLEELPAVLLTGPRGCGKTTTALRRAESVLRLDRPEQAGPFRAAPDEVLAAQRAPVLIDEWQVVPESMGAVKRAVDSAAG